MPLNLTNDAVRQHHDVAGTIAEGYFERFAPDVHRSAMGRVLRLERIADQFGSTDAFAAHIGMLRIGNLITECATSFALLAALPWLDVNIGQSGLTVTSVGHMVPASANRVAQLRDALTRRAYAALADIYETLWESWPHLGATATQCLERKPWRSLLCNNPHHWAQAARAAGIEPRHFFECHALLSHVEHELAGALLGPDFHREAVRQADANPADPMPEPFELLRGAIYLHAADRICDHPASRELAEELMRRARRRLEEQRDQYPLWAHTEHDSGQQPVYETQHRQQAFFKA